MTIKLCVIMDPIGSIQFKKDTTLGLLFAAQKKKWQIFYAQTKDLYLQDHQVQGNICEIKVHPDEHKWVTFLTSPQPMPLAYFDVVLMRKDPPIDLNYVYTTHLLELAQKQGAFILNNPRSLRDTNEKLFALQFPQCCPPTVVSSQIPVLQSFLQAQQLIAVKPLNQMGGYGIFILAHHDINTNATLELLTQNGQTPIMAQQFLTEIKNGDKRILMIDGKPYPFALARIPTPQDTRGNLAHGAKGVGYELRQRDLWLCEQIGPTLKEKGLFFVGIDVIGDYITEINVTSPTCAREIETIFKVDLCGYILDCLSEKLGA